MFRKLVKFKNKKAQNTAEYALLIALVVAGIIAMQTYAQRALQARIRAGANYLATQTVNLGDSTLQYEPYYLEREYEVARQSDSTEFLRQNGLAGMDGTDNTERGSGGFESFDYGSQFGLVNGV